MSNRHNRKFAKREEWNKNHTIEHMFDFTLNLDNVITVYCNKEPNFPFVVRVNLDNDDWLMERTFNDLTEAKEFAELLTLCFNQHEVYEFIKENGFYNFW